MRFDHKSAMPALNTKSVEKFSRLELENAAEPDKLRNGKNRLKPSRDDAHDSATDSETKKKPVPPAPAPTNTKLNSMQNNDFSPRAATQEITNRTSENNSSAKQQIALNLKSAFEKHKSKTMILSSAENSRSTSPAESANAVDRSGSDLAKPGKSAWETKPDSSQTSTVGVKLKTSGRDKIVSQTSDVNPKSAKFAGELPRKASEPAVMPYRPARTPAYDQDDDLEDSRPPALPTTARPNIRGPVPTPGEDILWCMNSAELISVSNLGSKCELNYFLDRKMSQCYFDYYYFLFRKLPVMDN